jgi:hypothetical protein
MIGNSKSREKIMSAQKTLEIVIAATVALASPTIAASQSVLERVLSQIDNAANLAPVNGTFANIAENLGGSGLVETVVPGQVERGDTLDENELVLIGYIYFEGFDGESAPYAVISGSTGDGDDERFGNGDAVYAVAGPDGVDLGQVTYTSDGAAVDGYVISAVAGSDYSTEVNGDPDNLVLSAAGNLADIGVSIPLGSVLFAVSGDGYGATLSNLSSLNNVDLEIAVETVDGMVPALVEVQGIYGIDGSINNTISGVQGATQAVQARLATATEVTVPTVDFGDMATTALGAVNTGEIRVGVNASVDEAKTQASRAIAAALEQVGGSVDTGAVIINVASNMTAIDGSIDNALQQVNGSIGDLSTTALGAVNTGTIVSGVNAAVQGIVGMGGQP